MTDFFSTAARSSSFLPNLKISNINDLKRVINTKMEELRASGLPRDKLNVNFVGAVIVQEMIKDLISVRGPKRIGDAAQERLNYFTSPAFITKFVEKLPVRDQINKTAAVTGYTEYFNALFNVKFTDWRDEKFSPVDNQSQCKRAMGIYASQNVRLLQDKGNIVCYICGRKIIKPYSTMECEHVLAIMTAISNWWLIKAPADSYTPGELNLLRMEYDWSHRCCNQIKSSYDFILFSNTDYQYKINDRVITSILNTIKTAKKYDCQDIKAREEIPTNQLIILRRRIQPIVDAINTNIKSFDDIQLYCLFSKFKILAAMSDDNFLASVLGIGQDSLADQKTASPAWPFRPTQIGRSIKGGKKKGFIQRGGMDEDEVIDNILFNDIFDPVVEDVVGEIDKTFLTKTHSYPTEQGATDTYFSDVAPMSEEEESVAKDTGFFPSGYLDSSKEESPYIPTNPFGVQPDQTFSARTRNTGVFPNTYQSDPRFNPFQQSFEPHVAEQQPTFSSRTRNTGVFPNTNQNYNPFQQSRHERWDDSMEIGGKNKNKNKPKKKKKKGKKKLAKKTSKNKV